MASINSENFEFVFVAKTDKLQRDLRSATGSIYEMATALGFTEEQAEALTKPIIDVATKARALGKAFETSAKGLQTFKNESKEVKKELTSLQKLFKDVDKARGGQFKGLDSSPYTNNATLRASSQIDDTLSQNLETQKQQNRELQEQERAYGTLVKLANDQTKATKNTLKASNQIGQALKNARVSGAVGRANAYGGLGLGPDYLANVRGTAEYTKMMDESVRGLANQRYALYDVSTTLNAIGIGLTAVTVGSGYMAARYEADFADVARTTQLYGRENVETLAQMHTELIQITKDLPVAFGDVTNIASMGAQLNISNENLSEFTRTISMFAATTDATVEASAMGLGRLSQLSGTAEAEISNLASSIYYTGINAVATESEILNVAQSIATAARMAGFANHETVALASALASLGVAPEQSRGAVMRIFSDITSAVGEGGEALYAFASTARMSEQAFAQLWSADPQKAFNAYLQGLASLDAALVDVTLKQQGFINIRDRNVLTRLSQNTEVYADALKDTAMAYAENTALAEGYGVVAETLMAKLTRMMNTINAVLAKIGDNPAFKFLADQLIEVVNWLDKVVSNPIGKWVFTVVAAFTGLAGIILILVGLGARAQASLLAMSTSLDAARVRAANTALTLGALNRELIRTSLSSTKLGQSLTNPRNALVAFAKGGLTMGAVSVAIYGVGKAVSWFSDRMKSAEQRTREFLGPIEGLNDALRADLTTYQETGKATAVLVYENEKLAESYSAARLAALEATDEIKQNILVIGEESRRLVGQKLVEGLFDSLNSEQAATLERLGVDWGVYTDRVVEDVKNGTDSAWSYIQGLFTAQRAELKKSFQDLSTSFGQDLDWNIFPIDSYLDVQYIMAAMASGTSDITNEQDKQILALGEQAKLYFDMEKRLGSIRGLSNVMGEDFAKGVYQASAMQQILGELDENFETASDKSAKLTERLAEVTKASFDVANATSQTQEVFESLGKAVADSGGSFSSYSAEGRAAINALEAVISDMAKNSAGDTNALVGNIGGLLSTLQSLGVDTGNELAYVYEMLNALAGERYGIDFSTDAARQNLRAFIADAIRAAEVAANIANTYSVSGVDAINASNRLKALREIEAALNGADKAGQLKQLNEGLTKTAKNAKSASKQVRTLVDYANDLQSITSRAFDIRFGNEQALDKSAKAWAAVQQHLTDAMDELATARERFDSVSVSIRDNVVSLQELQAELQGLNADQNTLQYFLSVAEKYDDVLRATEIRAKIADNNAKIARTENDILDNAIEANKLERDRAKALQSVQDAEKALSRTTIGTGKSAEEQRALIQDLVAAYQAEVVQMAESGATTQELTKRTNELRNRFYQQLTQMGYTRAEVDRYAGALDDLLTVIAKTPRNITVTANTNPAIQALNEYIAKLKQASTEASGLQTIASKPVVQRFSLEVSNALAQATKVASALAINAQIVKLQGDLSRTVSAQTAASLVTQIQGLRNQLKAGNFVSGGQVPQYLASGGVAELHPGSPRGTDTIPAWLTPNEHVVTAPAASRGEHRQILDAMNRGAVFSLSRGSSGGGGGANGMLRLHPADLHALINAFSVVLNIDGSRVAQAVNHYNANQSRRGY